MRYSIAFVAPLVAAVYAQSSGSALLPESSATSTYSNFENQFLTETNSLGVVTGEPTLSGNTAVVTSQPAVVTSQPAVVTSQPAVVTAQPPPASIPAGLATGVHTLNYGNSSFTVSVASSTSVVLTSTSTPSVAPTGTGADSGSGSPSGSASGSPSGSSTTHSPNAAAPTGINMLSGAVIGLGAVFAALL